jgi:trehalose 6-phosphate synthase/phosphatase
MAINAPRTIADNVKCILGVDRLDYTKGLTNRMLSLERLFEDHPELHGKVQFMQIAVPSRTDVKEYQELKEEMDKLVGMINGKFSTPTWSPIRYIYGCIPQDELAGYYRDADVALVTPLRDGMNLVAKEFVTCRVNAPGVLILSPFAGAGKFEFKKKMSKLSKIHFFFAILDLQFLTCNS